VNFGKVRTNLWMGRKKDKTVQLRCQGGNMPNEVGVKNQASELQILKSHIEDQSQTILLLQEKIERLEEMLNSLKIAPLPLAAIELKPRVSVNKPIPRRWNVPKISH